MYGFDTDKALASFDATKVSETGDNAVVKVTYSLMDTPISYDVNMVKRDGRWYSADAVKNIEEQLAKPTETAPPVAGPMTPDDMPPSDGSTPDMSTEQPADTSSDQEATPPANADDSGNQQQGN